MDGGVYALTSDDSIGILRYATLDYARMSNSVCERNEDLLTWLEKGVNHSRIDVALSM